MFWNLVRYRFKNVQQMVLPLCRLYYLSVIIGIHGSALSKYLLSRQRCSHYSSSSGFGGLVITLSISTLILIIQRFKEVSYDRRGCSSSSII